MRKFEMMSEPLDSKTSPFTAAEIAECQRRARAMVAGKVDAPTVEELRERGVLRSPPKGSRPPRRR